MPHDDLAFADLTDIAEALRKRELSAVDLTEAMLERIQTFEPQLRAFAFVSTDRARADAKKADDELRRGHWRGPLHGIPVAVKDLIDTAGVPTEAGMKIFAGNVPATDATCMARLHAAGAVLIGKTITSEGACTDHSYTPRPVNPWHASQSSGVSSSGSGVAVAAGLCYAALGTDTGGSIRVPSALNGITGLKPTWGRVSRHGVLPVAPQFDVTGPMARSASDVAAVMRAIAGADRFDPTASTQSVPDYLQTIAGGIDGLRIGIDEAFLTAVADASVIETVLAAKPELEARGARFLAVKMPAIDPMPMYIQAQAAMASSHRNNFPSRAHEYGTALRDVLEAAAKLSPIQVIDAVNAGHLLRAQIAALFEDIDLLLMPAIAALIQPVDGFGDALHDVREAQQSLFTLTFSVTGSPTITLPCALKNGLPTAIQLVGRHFDEALLLRAAYAYQQQTGWHRQRPPL